MIKMIMLLSAALVTLKAGLKPRKKRQARPAATSRDGFRHVERIPLEQYEDVLFGQRHDRTHSQQMEH